MHIHSILGAALLACMAGHAMAAEGDPPAAVVQSQNITTGKDGTITANGLMVPPSDLLSVEARSRVGQRLAQSAASTAGPPSVATARAMADTFLKSLVAKWLALHPSTIRSVTMNGVRVDEIVPAAGIAPANARRVLINLHGGGFFTGAGAGGQAESVPLAARGRIKVVAVDYGLAPEHRFPSASRDVEHVYRHLLKSYRPENIGIFGCSAGGALVAQSLTWFQREGLPRPGAAGIFCSGVMPGFWYGGDSLAVGQMLNGQAAATPEQIARSPGNLYLAGVEPKDALVTPGLFPDVLAKFPPTLLVTSTRDIAMSNALVTNVELLKAGVDTQLLVLEGTGHGEFNFLAGTRETTDAYAIIWRFFDRHLGH